MGVQYVAFIRCSACPTYFLDCGLQEYLPRALILELGIEDGSDRNCTPPTEQRVPSSGSAARKNSDSLSPYQAWFARAAYLLTAVLQEWERASRERSTLSPKGSEALNSYDKPPSPEEVTETILNGVHCCVAAMGTLLGEDWRNPIAASHLAGQNSATTPCDSREERERRSGREGSDEQFSPGNSSTSVVLDRGLQAFRLIGEIVSTVAGVETIAEALARRAFSLLGNPSRYQQTLCFASAHTRVLIWHVLKIDIQYDTSLRGGPQEVPLSLLDPPREDGPVHV